MKFKCISECTYNEASLRWEVRIAIAPDFGLGPSLPAILVHLAPDPYIVFSETFEAESEAREFAKTKMALTDAAIADGKTFPPCDYRECMDYGGELKCSSTTILPKNRPAYLENSAQN